jgi:hypothetical protein
VETKFVGNLGGVHGVGQILQVSVCSIARGTECGAAEGGIDGLESGDIEGTTPYSERHSRTGVRPSRQH